MSIESKYKSRNYFTEATITACKAVVSADVVASTTTKQRVMEALDRILRGEDVLPRTGGCGGGEPSKVLTYPEAARLLGYRNSHGVYKLVRKGLLVPVYGGLNRKRSHGVTRRSMDRLLGQDKE